MASFDGHDDMVDNHPNGGRIILCIVAIVVAYVIVLCASTFAHATTTRSRGPHTCTTPCVVVMARNTQEDEAFIDYIGARHSGDHHPRVLVCMRRPDTGGCK